MSIALTVADRLVGFHPPSYHRDTLLLSILYKLVEGSCAEVKSAFASNHQHETMHLVLFFTRGVSLSTWASVGSLERELAIYLRLQAKGIKVSFITFGGRDEWQYRERLQGIEILCNRWGLPAQWYQRLLPVLHARALSRAAVIKTNQTNGADLALRAARIWRKPLVARCGFMWSEFARRAGDRRQMETAQRIEKQVFEKAARVLVTTPAMKAYIAAHYPAVAENHVRVFPNYVLTDVFMPGAVQPDSNRICYVGRLHEQKNLGALVQACEGLGVELHLVGEGHLDAALQAQAARLGVRLVLHGNLPHSELPALIRGSAIFALVSHYEGHPKALLEAMSCGAAVLAADAPGIRQEISHGETGWLVGTEAASIRAGLRHLLSNPALREELGANARRYVLENYALDRVVEMEYALYQEILAK